MSESVVNLELELVRITEYWSPKIIAQMNDYHFKLAKVHGEFIWHSHSETDEAFIKESSIDLLRKQNATCCL